MRRPAACLSAFVTVAAVSVTAQAPAKHFLWSVRAPDAPATYLMGSLHALTPEYYPLGPPIERAFAESSVLIEEVDLDELTSPATLSALMAKAMLLDGRTLNQVVAADLYKSVVARAARAGIPEFALQRMKPWMAAVSLTAPALRAAGFDTAHGVDQYFFDRAKKKAMETRALETVAYQFDRLDQMPAAIQEAMLRSVISDLDTQLSNVRVIADAWVRGDVATLERLLLSAFLESPELYERLLVERNRNWLEAVERCVAEKTPCFVVVGAAHLVGPHSLVALLQKKGYTVEQH